MPSNTEKGKQFQTKCREALHRALGQTFDSEVSLTLSGNTDRSFDLATPKRDVVVECKAFTWTSGGNVPAGKIAHLREAVGRLRRIPGTPSLLLIVKRDPHPRRGETLAAYFARLNEDILGPVNVLELNEESGALTYVRGKVEVVPDDSRGHEALLHSLKQGTGEKVSVERLSLFRRWLIRILDWREGRQNREETPAKRVAKLRSMRMMPRRIADLMHSILSFRNEAEYEDYVPSKTEAAAIINAWKAVLEWAQAEGFVIPMDWH